MVRGRNNRFSPLVIKGRGTEKMQHMDTSRTKAERYLVTAAIRYPSLLSGTALEGGFFSDEVYGTAFECLREEHGYNAVRMSEYIGEEEASGLLKAAESPGRWKGVDERRAGEIFRDYEERLARQHQNDERYLEEQKYKCGEVSYEQFTTRMEEIGKIASAASRPLTFDSIMRRKNESRDGIDFAFFPELGEMLNIGTTDLMTVGADSGLGKTAFLINLAADFSTDPGKNVIYYNIEVDEASITDRLICARARNHITMREAHGVEQPDGTYAYLDKVIWTAQAIARYSNFTFVEGMTDIDAILEDILKKVDRTKQNIVFIDHVGLLTIRGEVQGFNRLEDIMKKLRVFTKSNRILTVCASQVRRDQEVKTLNSFSGSSEVENSSTHAIILTEPRSPETLKTQASLPSATTLIEAEVVKNRNGPKGTRTLWYFKNSQTIKENSEISLSEESTPDVGSRDLRI